MSRLAANIILRASKKFMRCHLRKKAGTIGMPLQKGIIVIGSGYSPGIFHRPILNENRVHFIPCEPETIVAGINILVLEPRFDQLPILQSARIPKVKEIDRKHRYNHAKFRRK